MKASIAFRINWTRAVQASGLSLSRLGRETGNSPSVMQDIAAGKYDNSQCGPGLFRVYRTLQPLQTAFDTLLPARQSERPGVNAFLSAFDGAGCSIEHFAHLLEFCDVYNEPTSSMTHLQRIGARSLLAQVTNLTDAALVQLDFEGWSLSRRSKIATRQRMAWDNGHVIDSEVYESGAPSSARHPRVPLILAACRVTDFDGLQKLLIYAEPLIHQPRRQ